MSRIIVYITHVLQKRIIQHLLFWLVVVIYFTLGYGEPGRYVETVQRVLLFLPGHIFLTYMFFYYLIPRFLNTQRYFVLTILGILIYFASLLYAYVVNFYLLKLLNIPGIWIGSPLIGQTTMLGAALAIKFVKQWHQEKKRRLEVMQQNAQAELDLLKSQIHPHFLFNTLNNLYSHVLDHSPKAPEIVLKLSELLRFMVYESAETYISLSKEISLIQNYLNLEQIRYGDRLEISYSLQGDVHNKQIAPLLLLPLIENAFKHGASNQIDQCWISIDIHVTGDWLSFKIINSKDPDDDARLTSSYSGVGIANVQKRLELIYGNEHSFEITNAGDVFVVNIGLKLLSHPVDILSHNPLNVLADGNY